ncbi:transposase [Colwellia sp. 4_MG-2023]|uniref:transposase n=2 Tax=unclassified Colwellia TaxID=196834 RepID=UPI0026E3F23C|nr:transposase [Colwellia sp. 4_MG-2023]MDO6555355.1 transposase [Colwellia sp. 4_MG-2023]
MTQSRRQQVSLQDTRYYHLISRCVRRAYLCGEDAYSKQSFEHRRQWMVDRIRFLTNIFAIDVAAYAVMSNHYHLVVYVDEEAALGWSNKDVCQRWLALYNNHPLVERWQQGTNSGEAETEAALAIIAKWRQRLSDLSWLMRNLNEYIARKANQEDNCKGRFWEGRFKSQALLDEKAVLACMAYVDLNPVRAKMVNSVQQSQFTSVYERIHDKASEVDKKQQLPFSHKPLLGFIGNEHKHAVKGIAFSLSDYLTLVQETGKVIRADKAGHFDAQVLPILNQLGLSNSQWLELAQRFGKQYHQAVGTIDELSAFAMHTNKKWISGHRQQATIFR